MPPLLRKEKDARTGSNLRGNPLRALRTKAAAKQARAYAPLAREYQRQCQKLFSKTDLRLAAKIAAEANAAWRAASVRVGGKAARLEKAKSAARQKFHRQLADALPSYRKWQTVQREHVLAQGVLVAAAQHELLSDRIHIDWGNLPELVANAQLFPAPFEYFACNTNDDDSDIEPDHSFAFPERGYVVNDFVFKHDADTPVIHGLFGFNRPELASNQTSCGIRYTVPKAGQLLVSGAFQNYVSNLTCSIHDDFGFSYSALDVQVELFIAFVQPQRISYLPTSLIAVRLESDGDNKSYVAPLLDASVSPPYTVWGTSPGSFSAGENVQIMVGAAVNITSEADDMTNHVNAHFEWRLDKIGVEVI